MLWKQNTNRSGGPRPHVKVGALCSRSMLETKTPNPSLHPWLPGRIKAIAEHQQSLHCWEVTRSFPGTQRAAPPGHAGSLTTRTRGSTTSGNVQSLFRNLNLHRHSPIRLLLSSSGPWKLVLENCRGFPLGLTPWWLTLHCGVVYDTEGSLEE